MMRRQNSREIDVFVNSLGVMVLAIAIICGAFFYLYVRPSHGDDLYRVPEICRPLASTYGVPDRVNAEEAIRLVVQLDRYSRWPGVRQGGMTETNIGQKLRKKNELIPLLRLGRKNKALRDSLESAPFGWAEQFKSGTVRDPIAAGMWQAFSAKLAGVNNFDATDWKWAGDNYLTNACRSAASKPPS